MEHQLQVEILKELMQQLDAGKNINAGVQYQMPTTSYVCPDTAKKEWSLFFRNHPQLIGLSHDLPKPGSYLTIEDFGTPILATRDKQGEFHAFVNACRHRSVRVASEERGTASVFMCPFHNWSYGNTGTLLTIPNEEHFGPIDKSCHGLVELPAVERDGLLWVNPDPDATLDIDDLLGELAPELASYNMASHHYGGTKTIKMRLNWKLANDTFGETYHFGKLHKNTLGQLYYGNNLHFKEFGLHHRFVTASRGIDSMRTKPESEWNIHHGTFVLYHLFPNIQLVVSKDSTTLVRIYPDPADSSQSITQVSFYFTADSSETNLDESVEINPEDVYNPEKRAGETRAASLAASFEVFRSTIEQEDYVMGEMQQTAAESGRLKYILFGQNEPALHHFHSNFRSMLGQPPLEKIIASST